MIQFAEMPSINRIGSVYFLFQGLEFELDDEKNIIKKNVDNRYLILNKINENGDKVPFIIDYISGKILKRINNQ